MQGIVIQGPTDFVDKVLDSYADIKNVVWSTWNDEPSKNIELIESSGIKVVLSQKPSFAGHGNVNMQTVSTNAGIQYLKSQGVKEILKARSDITINNVQLLLDKIKGKKISFLFINKPNVRPLHYDLVYHHSSFDFPGDFILYGQTTEIEKCFNFTVGKPMQIPAESLIVYSYCVKSNIDFNLDYDYLVRNGITFFAPECIENNIEIDWLKNPQKNYVMHLATDTEFATY